MIYLQTNDAGALLRFTDTYTKAVGGQMVVAMEPPTSETSTPRDGLINVRDFTVKGEAQLERVAAGAPNGTGSGISFSALRAEFTRQNGALTIRDGVVKGPMIGATTVLVPIIRLSATSTDSRGASEAASSPTPVTASSAGSSLRAGTRSPSGTSRNSPAVYPAWTAVITVAARPGETCRPPATAGVSDCGK